MAVHPTAGQDVAAEHCDVYLTWGEPPADVAEKLARVRRRASERGRTLSFGIRLHVVVRETAEAAWREADALIQHVDDEAIAFSQRTFARFDSVGQQRMARLHNGRRDKLEISPNLWAGVGLVRGGARHRAHVSGTPSRWRRGCASTLRIGIDRFILSGYPHLEECYRFAELVFPLLPLKPTTGHHPQPSPERRARSVRSSPTPLHRRDLTEEPVKSSLCTYFLACLYIDSPISDV